MYNVWWPRSEEVEMRKSLTFGQAILEPKRTDHRHVQRDGLCYQRTNGQRADQVRDRCVQLCDNVPFVFLHLSQELLVGGVGDEQAQ